MMKPMLAHTVEDASKIRFPVLASPKLDGIRCLIVGGRAYSRNMKLIPNEFIQTILQSYDMPNLDGELIVGDPTAANAFNVSTGAIRRTTGRPEFCFHVFDCWPAEGSINFSERLRHAERWINSNVKRHGGRVQLVQHINVADMDSLDLWEAGVLTLGYEGVMIRDPLGPYKFGRSTEREGYLGKVKRFADAEAKIIGFVERQHNTNEKVRDELGRAKRSSAKAGKVGTGTLGALSVRGEFNGKLTDFEIGTGFDDAQRAAIWAARDTLMGEVVKYKHQPVGATERPRFPVFLGFRAPFDL